MSKYWKSKKFKNNKMQNLKNEEIQKRVLEEKIDEENEKVQMETFSVKKYKTKFKKVDAYRLAEESTIHCADETKLIGHEGDFYVRLDAIHEMVLPSAIFKKLFILDLEKND